MSKNEVIPRLNRSPQVLSEDILGANRRQFSRWTIWKVCNVKFSEFLSVSTSPQGRYFCNGASACISIRHIRPSKLLQPSCSSTEETETLSVFRWKKGYLPFRRSLLCQGWEKGRTFDKYGPLSSKGNPTFAPRTAKSWNSTRTVPRPKFRGLHRSPLIPRRIWRLSQTILRP